MEPFYDDGCVTLFNADSLEHPELWAGGDVLVTDPPYGMRYLCGHNRSDRYGRINGDESTAVRDAALDVWNGMGGGVVRRLCSATGGTRSPMVRGSGLSGGRLARPAWAI